MSEERIDVMIDLETLGLDNDCVILSAAFVPFDIFTGEQTEAHSYDIIKPQDQIDIGRSVTWGTIKWWMQQEDKARYEFMNSEVMGYDKWKQHVRLGFHELNSKFKDVIVWSNGENFDICILEDVFKDGMPWRYWAARDVRTVVDVYQMMGFPKEPKKPFEGTKHNAYYDCLNQIRYTCNMLKKIRSAHV